MFAPAFAPLGNPEAIVNTNLALAFLAAGWDVEILTRDLSGMTDYMYAMEWENSWLPLKNRTHEIQYPGKKLTAIGDTLFQGMRGGYLIEGCRWAMRAYDAALVLHRKKPFDVVLSRAQPHVAHLGAMLFAGRVGIPWIANWNDPIVHPSLESNYPPLALGTIEKRFIARVARDANLHTFPAERLKNHAGHYFPVLAERARIIPHVAHAHTPSKPQLPRRIFTLCHVGNLGPGRDPEVLFRAVADLVRRENAADSVEMKFIGISSYDLAMLAKKYQLEHMLRFMGRLRHSEIQTHLDSADVLVVLEAPIQEGIYLPSKFVEYAETGTPVIAISPRTGTLPDLLDQYGGGIAVDARSVEDVAHGIETLFRLWKDDRLSASFNSASLCSYFSPERIIHEYEQMFSSVRIKA